MTAPTRAYAPGTDSIDITAPGGIDALLEFHRRTFGDAQMRANEGDADEDDTDTEDDDAGQSTADDDASDETAEDDDTEGVEDLGDKGKQALDRMKSQRNDERKKRRELEQRLAELSATDDDDKDRREVETAALSKANTRILRSEIKAAAKGVLADPSDAYQFLDLDQFEVDENGDVDEEEIAEALSELVKKKPYLAAQGERRFKGDAGGGAGKQSRPKQLTRADLARMTPAEIDKAHRDGRLADLLKS